MEVLATEITSFLFLTPFNPGLLNGEQSYVFPYSRWPQAESFLPHWCLLDQTKPDKEPNEANGDTGQKPLENVILVYEQSIKKGYPEEYYPDDLPYPVLFKAKGGLPNRRTIKKDLKRVPIPDQ